MPEIQLATPTKSHLLNVVDALAASGWRLERIPATGRLLRNGQKILLKSDQLDLRFRLFVYKVGGSSRNRPEERRIEITSTYQKGLQRIRDFPDVVLGYDSIKQIFVGVDSERIEHGGPTGNASSFFDIDGLGSSRAKGMTISQRKAILFPKGIEYHAFVTPQRLAEYFYNRESIHDGAYSGQGLFSGTFVPSGKAFSNAVPEKDAQGDVLILKGPSSKRRKIDRNFDDAVIEAFENGTIPQAQKTKKITPEEFAELMKLMAENGLLGEECVVNAERRRLRKAGRPDLASKVHWISQDSIGEGFDIVSYETDGAKRFIEVKATVGTQNTFDMSDNEWKTACHLGASYYLCRVTRVRVKPTISYFCNPQQLEIDGKVKRIASGWRVTLI
jgi:Domain of unknown function (DUF3883)